jgi:hypothetical protein
VTSAWTYERPHLPSHTQAAAVHYSIFVIGVWVFYYCQPDRELMRMLLLPASSATRATMHLLLRACACCLGCCAYCDYLPLCMRLLLHAYACMLLCMHAMLLGMHTGTASTCACFPCLLMKTLNMKHLLQHTSETDEIFGNMCLQHIMTTATYATSR